MSSQPNVILIMTDDQGYGDMACHGNPVAQTPALDALHADSVRFNDFHAAPMCTPTRGQLLTGLDAARNGAMNVSSGRTLLRADSPTMADLFKDAGYATGIFGKWHLGDNFPHRPQDRGFEETLWFPSSHISSLPDYWENDYFDDVYCHNGVRKRMSGYCTEVFFEESKKWMQAQINDNKPFFTYLPTNAPHYPWYVPTADREAIEKEFAAQPDLYPDLDDEQRESVIRFLAMIRNLDTEIGKLRQFLEETGVADNTIFMFTTDNGSTFGPLYYNAGMRGAKCSLWEGGHRVPYFMHWPDGGLTGGKEINGLAQMQDILPTLIDFCGLKNADVKYDGISLSNILQNDEHIPEDRLICVNYSRMPNFDYPCPESQAIMRREGAGVLWKQWRLLECTALYDLEKDPMQEHNVIEEHPDIANTMIQALDNWWEDVKDIANTAQRIIIGNDAENPGMLTGCEWWDVFLDQQNQARLGVHRNSYWHLDVAQTGTYRFELRRWPVESELKLQEACTETIITDGVLPAGVALPIAGARIHIAQHDERKWCEASDEAVSFELELETGPCELYTWFLNERNESITGAYYVYVERISA